MKVNILLGLAILTGIILYSSVFIVEEGRQAIVTQFGEPRGGPKTKAGVYFKTPILQDVRYVDKRILTWDGDPNRIPTKGKKYIWVDTTARWRITDTLKFIQAVRTEDGAKERLDSILDGITRDVISGHSLVEAVRNTNDIIARISEKKKNRDKTNIEDDEITGEIKRIEIGREELSNMIAKKADVEVKQFGISIIDVQLRRIAYEKSVEKKVYERMISERSRIAEKIRSVGKGEKAKIEGRLSKDLQVIESIAYRRAKEIQGQAEAKSIKIYAAALSRDPTFYDFIRTMDAYKNSLSNKAEFIFSSENDFLKYFK